MKDFDLPYVISLKRKCGYWKKMMKEKFLHERIFRLKARKSGVDINGKG